MLILGIHLSKVHGPVNKKNTDSYRRPLVDLLTWFAGVDVVLDCVGGSQFKDAMKCVKWGAHIMPIGFASGSIPTVSTHQTELFHA